MIHAYNNHYFLLDIINNCNINEEIPNTYRGQPKEWNRYEYNSSVNAFKAFEDLIKNTNSTYIIISYNNKGIITIEKLELILKKYGELKKEIIEHKTYNRLTGLANYKRENKITTTNEFIYILKTFK